MKLGICLWISAVDTRSPRPHPGNDRGAASPQRHGPSSALTYELLLLLFDPEDPDDALEVVDSRELDDNLALAPADVDLHAGVEPIRQTVGEIGERRRMRLRAPLRRRPASRLVRRRRARPAPRWRGPTGPRQRFGGLARPARRSPPGQAAHERARRRARPPPPGVAPPAAGSAGGSCSRSADGCGRCAARARRAWRRTPRAAAGTRPPLRAGSGWRGECSPAARPAASRRRGCPG